MPTTTHVYRHPLPVRVSHWINLLALLVLLGSGLQIYNAHPSLYWGSRSDPERALLAMSAHRAGDGQLRGTTRLFQWEFDTTGLLGVSTGPSGTEEIRGFPPWATIPSQRWLAMGRRWHFFFAWVFVLNGSFYLGYSLFSRHRRDLLPSGEELRGLGRSLRTHLKLRHLRAESARGYNVLQKLAYLAVLLILGPLILLTGLTMSPWLDSTFPWLLTLFDGRQSARTLHFVAAFGFVLFTLIHVTMVLLVGPYNHVRAMLTGRLSVPQ